MKGARGSSRQGKGKEGEEEGQFGARKERKKGGKRNGEAGKDKKKRKRHQLNVK